MENNEMPKAKVEKIEVPAPLKVMGLDKGDIANADLSSHQSSGISASASTPSSPLTTSTTSISGSNILDAIKTLLFDTPANIAENITEMIGQ